MAKLFTSEAACRCADRCVQAFGGRGYLRSNVAERLLRELRVDRIWEGTSEIQRLIVARGLERRGVERSSTEVTPHRTSTPLLAAAVGRGRRGQRPPRLLRRQRSSRNLDRGRLRGRGLGRQPEARRGPRPALRADASPSCPSRSTRSSSRSRRRRCRRSSASSAARGCGGAIVVLGRLRRGRGGPRARGRAARGRARGRASRSAGRTATGSSPSAARAPLWGDSVPSARARARWR